MGKSRLALHTARDRIGHYLDGVWFVLLALASSGIKIELGVKFILVTPVAVALSFAVGHLARKLPFARDIL